MVAGLLRVNAAKALAASTWYKNFHFGGEMFLYL
jgi:hypothetical protein